MAQIIAEIDLTGLSITGIQTVVITTTDIYGVNMTLCTITQDWTGMTVNSFINALVLCVNAGGSGFLAFNDNPIITFTRDVDVTLFIGQQVDITYNDGVRDVFLGSASWVEVVAERTGCDACYPYDLVACYGNFIVDVDLQASTNYTLLFTDKFGKKYQQAVTTDVSGAFTILTDSFPEGFFTPEFGAITVSVLNTAGVPVTFTIGYAIYDCLQLNVDYVTTIS